jgi:hypothetical protein
LAIAAWSLSLHHRKDVIADSVELRSQNLLALVVDPDCERLPHSVDEVGDLYQFRGYCGGARIQPPRPEQPRWVGGLTSRLIEVPISQIATTGA